MKKLLFLFAIIAFSTNTLFAQLGTGLPDRFTRKDSLRGTLSNIRNNYDVKFYNLDIEIDIEKKFISGFNEITFLAIENISRLQIDLFDNMKINKIEHNNKSLNYTREFNAVFIDFSKTITKGSVSKIKVFYEGNPIVAKRAPWDGGFVFKKDKNGNAHVAVACQGTGASLWWPNKDHQSDEPDSMAINITSSSLYEEVSNGRLRAKKDLGNGYTRFEWFVSNPINNYNVSVNIADYYHWTDTYTSKVDGEILSLDYYVLKDDKEKALTQFEQVKPMMDAFEKRFGKYAFYTDGYKLVQTPYLGMEHQSCVAYGNAFKNGYLGFDLSGSGEGMKFDYIIIHETAHEWWGNNVTSYDIADMWIHEGFGQYSEVVYLEELYGRESATKYLNGIKKGIGNKEPVIGPYGVNKEGSGDMYPKGALFLNTLRNYINDDKIWWDIIKSIQTEYRHKNISTNDVLALMNKKSGKELKPIFDQYLKHANLPELILYTKSENNALLLTYQWKTDVSDFNMPIDVFINDEKQRIYPSNTVQTKRYENVKLENFSVDKNGFYIKISQNK
jgi:aminopeptidase N